MSSKPIYLDLRLGQKSVRFDRCAVMAVLNVTPDSFYAGSRTFDVGHINCRVADIIESEADIIDVGGYSTRPGADVVSVAEECSRVARALDVIRHWDAEIPVSLDTFRSEVARFVYERFGPIIVNDISGGTLDDTMPDFIAETGLPYVLMHTRGTPQTMHKLTDYDDVTHDVISELSDRVDCFCRAGADRRQIIIDPGFGFAKTLEQNYKLMADLDVFQLLGLPVLVGVSRKSMIYRYLNIDASQSLAPTIALGAYALNRGGAVLRVHDVREAVESVKIYEALKKYS